MVGKGGGGGGGGRRTRENFGSLEYAFREKIGENEKMGQEERIDAIFVVVFFF